MAFSPLTDHDPREVGSYRLTGRLGAGGMGIVYLARTKAGIPVAIKVIRPEFAADPTFRARFAREVALGRRVDGVCIARFLDADTDADQPYLVTEFVDGPSLAEVVTARGPFAGPQLQALAAGLVDGLVSLHRAGVVHRDLKPGNVLLARDAPKIIDFGIAHAGDSTSMTRTGHVVGSAAWMSPEQASGQAVTPAADVFAWASVMVYAATGHNPFGEGAPAAILYRVVHHDPDLEGVPPALLEPLRAAFNKEPDLRPEPSELLAMVTAETGADPGDGVTRVLDVAWQPVPPVEVEATKARDAALAEPLTPTPASSETTTWTKVRNGLVVGAIALVALLAGLALASRLTGDDDPGPPPTTAVPPVTTTEPETTTSTSTSTSTTTSTTTTTTIPPNVNASWAEITDALPGGAAFSRVYEADQPLAVSAVDADVTVWGWDGENWNETGFLILDGPIDGPNALTPVELTSTGPIDFFVQLGGERRAVVSLPDSRGRIVEFAVPDSRLTVSSIDEGYTARSGITGRIEEFDGEIDWSYHSGNQVFRVDDARPDDRGDD